MLNRQVFKPRVFTTFSINLKDYVLTNEIVGFKDVLICVECVSIILLSDSADANVVKLVHIVVGLAHSLARVSTVVLVVGHGMIGSDVTTQVIKAVDADIDHCLGSVEEVFTDNIATVITFSVPLELAIRILA
jgi:hypothetical protein